MKKMLLCLSLSFILSRFCSAGESDEPVGMATEDIPEAPPMEPTIKPHETVTKEPTISKKTKSPEVESGKTGKAGDSFLDELTTGVKLRKTPAKNPAGGESPPVPHTQSLQEEMKKKLAQRRGGLKPVSEVSIDIITSLKGLNDSLYQLARIDENDSQGSKSSTRVTGGRAGLRRVNVPPQKPEEPKKETELDRRMRERREKTGIPG